MHISLLQLTLKHHIQARIIRKIVIEDATQNAIVNIISIVRTEDAIDIDAANAKLNGTEDANTDDSSIILQ